MNRPSICLNMIVRNEAHVVHEVLDCVAPYISTWAVVDTGSTDGTQDIIRAHMGTLGIPGELIERPWRDFGHNRSEALDFAAGRADYIWVIDADDLVVGNPDFSVLDADCYELHYGPPGGMTYWRPQLFRDGLPWRYDGVVHEIARCDEPHTRFRLEGDYYIDSRRLGGRNLDPQKYARDRDLLLADLERDPDNSRSVFYLAQSYYDLGDFENARKWYQRRTEMGGWDEEIYFSYYRVGDSMVNLEEPWPDTQDALLRAWEFRPHRAEALTTLARTYRLNGRYALGHLFASKAAAIPLPEHDALFVFNGVYEWASLDEQAVCASNLGWYSEAFTLCRQLLAREGVPAVDRERIAVNRDISVQPMLADSYNYSDDIVRSMHAAAPNAEVTVTLDTGASLQTAEQSMNSLLNSFIDRSRIGRFLVDDSQLSPQDRAAFADRYPFTESLGPPSPESPGERLRRISEMIGGRFWFYIGSGWRFFAPEALISRLIAVMDAESVLQVAVNFEDTGELTGRNAPEEIVRRSVSTGRYVLTDSVAWGPAIIDMERLRHIGGIDPAAEDIRGDLTSRALAAGLRTATLDEVLCIGFQ